MEANKPTRQYFSLPSGDRLPLPLFPWEHSEFSLVGNSQVLAGGRLVALYDETSRTGAIWHNFSGLQFWKLIQPCRRDDFFAGAKIDADYLLSLPAA